MPRGRKQQHYLLKCTSSYPAPIEEANMATIPDLKERFRVEVGLSDHTMGIVAPIVAVTLGARVIEKHFILNKTIGGPDASFSLDEKEFTEMVKAIRDAEKAIGKITYELTEKVKASRKFSRSLFVVKDIKKGEKFTEENVRSIRPGYGLHPKYLKKVLGEKADMNIEKGTPLNWDNILGSSPILMENGVKWVAWRSSKHHPSLPYYLLCKA